MCTGNAEDDAPCVHVYEVMCMCVCLPRYCSGANIGVAVEITIVNSLGLVLQV